MEDCATHIAPLALAIKRFGGRVLEIGCGWYSTQLIHAMSDCAITLENDSSWYQKLRPSIGGQFYHIKDIPATVRNMAEKQKFDVVFVDCYEGIDRVECSKLFLDLPCCIVAHDTERPYWSELLASIKYKRHFKILTPNTSWLSNVLDVTK